MFLWEYMNTLRKVLIVIAFLLPNNYKIGISIIVLVASERLERKFSPYKLYDNNRLAMFSTVAGIITLNASYVYEKDENISHLNSCILIIIVYINAKFSIEWFYLLLKCFKSKYKVIEYAFLLASKMLCKKIVDEEPKDETQIVPNAHKKLVDIPSKRHQKSKRKKNKKRTKKIAFKRPKSKFPSNPNDTTSRLRDPTTLRDHLSPSSPPLSLFPPSQSPSPLPSIPHIPKLPLEIPSSSTPPSQTIPDFYAQRPITPKRSHI